MDQNTAGTPTSGGAPVPPAGNSNDGAFWKFQGNQFILLVIYSVATMVASIVLAFIPVIGWLAILALQIFGLVLFIMWIINVVNKQMKPLPVIGNMFTFIK